MENYPIYSNIDKICLIGYGSIGKGALPLIKRHFTFKEFTIIDPVEVPDEKQKVNFIKVALTKDNYEEYLSKVFDGEKGTKFCVNLSVGTSSLEILQFCQKKQALYIDTVKEQWKGYYGDKELSLQTRTNYSIRHRMLTLVKANPYKTTAVSCCGANPGMVSWLVKAALINLAKDMKFELEHQPRGREQWTLLMKNLGVKGLHIAERDSQRVAQIRPIKSFWNTWSVDGFISQAYHQSAELGWGTHEKWMPPSAIEHKYGSQCSIYIPQPGMNTHVKTWCPTYGPQLGFLVTHDEVISIPDYYTLKQNDKVVYRPTCSYAYHPSEDTINSSVECIGSGVLQSESEWRILQEEIIDGSDELGVLLYGHSENAYWYGSQLDIKKARSLVPHQNATGLQVSSAVLAGMVWAVQNPHQGLVQCDQMDYKRCLEVQKPYIEPVNGFYTDWNPLKNKVHDFNEDHYDNTDPWQFKNILIHK